MSGGEPDGGRCRSDSDLDDYGTVPEDDRLRGPPRVNRNVTQRQNLAAALLQVDEDEAIKINTKLKNAWIESEKTKTRSSDDEWTLLIKYICKRALLAKKGLTEKDLEWENILEQVPGAISRNISQTVTDEKREIITNFLISALKEASYKGKSLIDILNEEFKNRGRATEKNVQYYMNLNDRTTIKLFRETEDLEARRDKDFGDISSIDGESKGGNFQLRF